ncbi:hypothetical protein Tco_0322409 [Tanacetum coccineum]
MAHLIWYLMQLDILNGHSIHSTNRSHTWMDLSQIITYNQTLSHTRGRPMGGWKIEINDDMWHEICGSFRIEKQAGKVMVYIQGPSPSYSDVVLLIISDSAQAIDKDKYSQHALKWAVEHNLGHGQTIVLIYKQFSKLFMKAAILPLENGLLKVIEV